MNRTTTWLLVILMLTGCDAVLTAFNRAAPAPCQITPIREQVFVRLGPTVSGAALTRLESSSMYPVIGRSADGLWVVVNANNTSGWVPLEAVGFSGDCTSVDFVNPNFGIAIPYPPATTEEAPPSPATTEQVPPPVTTEQVPLPPATTEQVPPPAMTEQVPPPPATTEEVPPPATTEEA